VHSLRERKKADTRDAIRAAAVERFCAQGFEATTMEAIAEDANVSVRTVFRYFPTKEDLVFADVEEDLVDLRQLLDARPDDEPVMASVRAVVETLASRVEDGPEKDVRLAPLLHSEPALRRRHLEVLDRIEETVADWARVRLDAGPHDLRPGLLAACMVSIQRVVVDAVVDGDPRPLPDLIREAIALLSEGFDQLEPA
jgi:AcrR family transcriptional regulator